MLKQRDWHQKAVSLLSQMVSIASVNPGDKVTTDTNYTEQRMAQFLINYFQQQTCHYDVTSEEILPGRPNVYIKTGHSSTKRTLLLETHLDTVDVQEMTIDPFAPVLKEGKLFGRGSCDAKGQLTAMILGLEMAIEQTNGHLPINVILAATVDEEHLHRGVDRMVANKTAADGAVAGEPTELKLVTATKGSIRFKIITTGKSAHTASPEEGVNAIYLMADVIQAINKNLIPQLITRTHPLCGNATAAVTVIKGGQQVNIVPDNCVIDVDRRLLPGEDWEMAFIEIKNTVLNYVDANLHGNIQFEHPYLIDPSLETDLKSSLVWALGDLLSQRGEESQAVGVPFGTDASKIALLGIPTVVFGPGSIKQAHTKDEYIKIEEIIKAAEIYRDLMLHFHQYFDEEGTAWA